jgi:acyl carrier protein
MTTGEAQAATPTQEALAEIWRDLFGIGEVGPDDDFFELGGNSLTAVKFLSRVEERFAVDVLLPETLYEDARLASLASAIDKEMV